MDEELVARLSRRGNRYDDGAMMHGELINPDGPAAIACIEDLTAKAEALAEALRGCACDCIGHCDAMEWLTPDQSTCSHAAAVAALKAWNATPPANP